MDLSHREMLNTLFGNTNWKHTNHPTFAYARLMTQHNKIKPEKGKQAPHGQCGGNH
jgi:hypothetical protein